MSEDKVKRPDTIYVPPVIEPEGKENEDYIVTNIGTGKKSLTKYCSLVKNMLTSSNYVAE